MIEEQALVISSTSKQLLAAPSKIRVKVQRKSACDSCQLKTGCGQHTLTKLSENNCIEFDVSNTVDASQGDLVVLSIPEQGLLSASLMVYLLPILVMLVFSVSVRTIFSVNDGLVALSGLFGLCLGFLFTHLYGKKHAQDLRFHPQIIRKYEL
jgi:sigma-E factor negative regulatory protein RseC